MAQKNAIVTLRRRSDLVRASAGAVTLPVITGMVFGDGGDDGEGNVIAPAEDQAELKHELFRKAIDGYSFPADTICRYNCTLKESELADSDISEIGLYDANGNIVAIKTFRRKGKDADLEMTFTLDDVF